MLYAFYQDEDSDVVKTKKRTSIEKMQELYLLLLLMIGSISRMQLIASKRVERSNCPPRRTCIRTPSL